MLYSLHNNKGFKAEVIQIQLSETYMLKSLCNERNSNMFTNTVASVALSVFRCSLPIVAMLCLGPLNVS